jgi:hypothetical protein
MNNLTDAEKIAELNKLIETGHRTVEVIVWNAWLQSNPMLPLDG